MTASATTILSILRFAATVLNLQIVLILAYFMAPLRWSNERDRVSLVGFGFMLGAIILNAVLVWL